MGVASFPLWKSKLSRKESPGLRRTDQESPIKGGDGKDFKEMPSALSWSQTIASRNTHSECPSSKQYTVFSMILSSAGWGHRDLGGLIQSPLVGGASNPVGGGRDFSLDSIG